MLNVCLYIFDEVVPSSVTGVVDLLSGANRYMERAGKKASFVIHLVTEKGHQIPFNFVNPDIRHQNYEDVLKADLIIIPSFSVGNDGVLMRNKAAIDWIKGMSAKGAEVASLCVGSYFLAEAGLLDGKEVTSHWAVAADMQKLYPNIRMKSDLVITDQDGVYTSGGAFSSLKLILYLIEKFCGREAALWISKMFAIEMDTTSQAHFKVFTGQHQHDDKNILKAQQYIEENYSNDIGMEEVSSLANMSKRNFIRRFKAATNNTPSEYLQRVRIESAKKAIEMNHKDLPFIIEDTGYSDLKTFRKVFRRITGLSPMEYKRKYARG
ncbi:GlxA family transcriptional regulator [Pedobacter caeni]|uniref:Transcriptional regulator, AraC family with amidase-like domain n=1 Tax=Pedobacter caeni TaxID=288992 RepID=A0A1M4UK88_9SPHI|nr:helix-turn-helix domain-containing protein [Pedobacter caeni]SHE57109.1 transcriptional regulator, AraC family with amidase-like domain [Pedobacter caeni]